MYTVFIAGAGGIGSAVGLLLREFYAVNVNLIIGDIHSEAVQKAIEWIERGGKSQGTIEGVVMTGSWEGSLSEIDMVLDCLPGRFAPAMAKYALVKNSHYVNLTEYVKETKEIMALANGASTGFGLQAGLAPGFVNVLGRKLFDEFCSEYKVSRASNLEMRVGALPRNSIAPHFYGFTWSTIGVATEYVKPAEVVRDNKMLMVPSLSERRSLMVDGVWLEEDLTSGGAADIPQAFADKITNIDYKTLRYPGHWAWVDSLIEAIPTGEDIIDRLEKAMLEVVPSLEDDLVVVYAAVQGKDASGRLRRLEASYSVEPIVIGGVTLRAIQSTTAAGMAEVARLLLEGQYHGVVLQSQIDPAEFFSGPFVSKVYGTQR